tara:strand:- start:1256 stop:2032 length:777 start_codon:yes stop_codon:yes gene_type:complete
MVMVRINKVDLNYEVYGTGPIPMVFIHGYACRGEIYRELFDELTDTFTIYALDLRSHGGSAHVTDNCTIAQWVDDIITFMEVTNLQRPVYAGHSLGGALGLAVSLIRDNVFRAICCINTFPASGSNGVPDEVIRAALASHGNKPVMLQNYEDMFVRQPTNLVEDCVDAALLVASGPYELYLTVETLNFDITAELDQIQPPVLVLGGVKDRVCHPPAIHETALGLSHCKEVTFSDEGHMMPLESPRRTAMEVKGFVNGL